MDGSGAVIGIAVATFRGGQNLNLAVPVSYLSKLLALRSNNSIPFSGKRVPGRIEASIVEGIGTATEKGLAITDYQLLWNEIGLSNNGNFEFRLTNKLPVGISNVHLLLLYYDAANTLMDYERLDVSYYLSRADSTLPAGLAKTIHARATDVSSHAAEYYKKKVTAPKVEIRVLAFDTEKPD